MLKYIAIFQATHSYTCGLDPEQLGRVTRLVQKSPTQETKAQAEKWIETIKKAYPEKYYRVEHCIISFEESEKENVETMLKSLIMMF